MKKVIRFAVLVLVLILAIAGTAVAGGKASKGSSTESGDNNSRESDSARVVNTYVLYENNKPYVGDEVILVVELAGYKEGTYKIQWQYSSDGEQWYDAEGATEAKYSFVLTFDNLNYHWRVKVIDIDS